MRRVESVGNALCAAFLDGPIMNIERHGRGC